MGLGAIQAVVEPRMYIVLVLDMHNMIVENECRNFVDYGIYDLMGQPVWPRRCGD
jgi:hypothetical protein